jgi:hypothetical protein
MNDGEESRKIQGSKSKIESFDIKTQMKCTYGCGATVNAITQE